MATKKGIRFTNGYDDLAADAAVAGARAYANWLEGKSTRYLLMTVALVLTITGTATSIVGFGSPIQVFDEVGLDMGGRVTAFSPYHLIAISDYLTSSTRTYTRATSTAIATYNLTEQYIVPFEYPHRQIFATEVRFREDDTSKRVRLFYKLNATANGLANLVIGGTAAVTGVTVNVSQVYDPDLLCDPPTFRPWFEEKYKDIGQATVKGYLELDLTQVCRGLTILQLTNVGMVADIITAIGLQGTNFKYIGDNGLVDVQRYAKGLEFEAFGADVYRTSVGGMIHLDFAKLKLSKALNPNQDSNFRLYFNALPSVRAGATWSRIVVLEHLLERSGKMRQDGQFVTAPTLPASLDAHRA
jgi:hypothetical protein